MSALKERLARAKQRVDEAKSLLSDDDREELNQRAEIARLDQEADDELEKARQLAADRALEAIREKFPKGKFAAVLIKGFPDWFIVKGDGKAHAAWTNAIGEAAQADKSIDRNDLSRQYALKVIEVWNGTDRGEDPKITNALNTFLTEAPGAVTAVTNASAELVGLIAQARKS